VSDDVQQYYLTDGNSQGRCVAGRSGAVGLYAECVEENESNAHVDGDHVAEVEDGTAFFDDLLGRWHGVLDGDDPTEERLGFVNVCLHGGEIVVHAVDHGGGVGDRGIQVLGGYEYEMEWL